MTKDTDKPLLGSRFRYKSSYINSYMSLSALEAKKRVIVKIATGEYRYAPCDCYCGSNDSVFLSETDWFGFYYPLRLCKRCGIMRVDPRLDEESYKNFYVLEYRTIYEGNIKDKDQIYELGFDPARKVYDFITKHISLPPKAVVFDVGCKMGNMLLPFYNRGYEVMGVDYGAEYVEFGRKKSGLKLAVGSIEKLKGSGKKADLVILNHVLEHFLDLEKELKSIREVMKPGGFIFIALPGTFWWVKNKCAGNIMGLLQNAHTYQFSLNSVRYVLECCGYEFVCGDEEVKSIFKLSNIFRSKDDIPEKEPGQVYDYLLKTEHEYLPRFYLTKTLEKLGIKGIIKKIIKV